MNSRKISIMISALFIFIPIADADAANKVNKAGRATKVTTNTILNGKGAPLKTLGIDGDFYIDTRSLQMYGPKINGKWPAPVSLQGPSGVDGKNGVDAKTTTNASTVAGAKGDKGEKGDSGPAGPPGPAGADGTPGAPGAKGADGSNGVNGTNGTNGSKGDPGDQGPIGPAGPKGETGTAGAKGDTGPIGPSLVETGTVTIPNLKASAGSGQTVSISGFRANKSYLVRMIINSHPTLTADPTVDGNYALGFIASTSNSIVAWTQYVVGKSESYRTGVLGGQFENFIDAEILLPANGVDTSYNLIIEVNCGNSTNTLDLAFSASFTAIQVGGIAAH